MSMLIVAIPELLVTLVIAPVGVYVGDESCPAATCVVDELD